MVHLINWLVEEKYKPRLQWIVTEFSPSDFKGIDAILMDFLRVCNYCSIPVNDTSLEMYITTELKQFLIQNKFQYDTTDYIDYSNPLAVDNALTPIGALLNAKYEDYKDAPKGQSFKQDAFLRLKDIRKDKLINIVEEIYTKSDSEWDDSYLDKVSNTTFNIKNNFSNNKLDSFNIISGEPESDEDDKKMTHLFDTGLAYIDSSAGGIYSSCLYTLTGISKGGKTRLAVKHFAYQAMLAGFDVKFFELEMSKSQIKNMIYSCHINALSGGKTKISDFNIGRGYAEDFVTMAKTDLNSGDYGHIYIAEELNIEDIENEFALIAQNPKCKLVVIDLMGKITTNLKDFKYKDVAGIVSTAYPIIKRMARKYDLSVLAINQLNNEGVEAILNGKKFRQGFTEGGQSTQRNTDYDLVLGMTYEQEVADIRTLENYVSRIGKKANGLAKLKVDLGYIRFQEIIEE